MDLASLLGLLGCLGMILFAMVMGGDPMAYVDVTSILIVFGGTFFAVMYTAPLPVFLGSFGVMAKAFLPPIKKQEALFTKKQKTFFLAFYFSQKQHFFAHRWAKG